MTELNKICGEVIITPLFQSSAVTELNKICGEVIITPLF